MHVIPVLDLKHGQVVRGVAGRREEYRAIESRLVQGAAPESVACALVDAFSFDEVYLADLDAIGGAPPTWEAYRRVAACGLRLWVDAGVSDRARAQQLALFRPHDARLLARVVAGLESLPDETALHDILESIGAERLVFSLDLKDGQPITQVAAWESLTAIDIAGFAVDCGVRGMIVLDLARVGVGQGTGTEDLCRELRRRHPHLELISGGGVRSIADLHALAAAGCDQVLVASALHDGRLTNDDLAPFRR